MKSSARFSYAKSSILQVSWHYKQNFKKGRAQGFSVAMERSVTWLHEKKKAYWSVYSRSLHIISKTQRNVLMNRKTKSAQTTYHIGGLVLGNYLINSTWNAFDTMIYFERQKNLQNIDILQFAYNCLVLSKTEIFSVVKASCALKDRRFSERSVRLTYVSHIAHVLSIFSIG